MCHLAFMKALAPYLPQVGDRFGADIQMVHTACHPMEMMLAVISMISGGVLERHPNLRVAFLRATVAGYRSCCGVWMNTTK